MVTSLQEALTDTISSGLMRRSITSCSRWANNYRMMGKPIPGPFGYKYHPWLRAMHDSLASKNVGQKAAQMGYTEWALNRTFYAIDVKRTDVLYVLPNKHPDATDFSSARFDAALELSPHLQSLFSDVKNVGHKRAGDVNLYVRGSRSRGGMKSIPVGMMVLDEFDEMDHAQVVLAVERMSGQFEKELLELSTPTLPNWGINAEFQQTTQEHFMFQCPCCSRWTEFFFPQCLVITAESLTDKRIYDSHYVCNECKGVIPHEGKADLLKNAQWESTVNASDSDVRGFYINQLYSSTISPVELARSAIRAMLDPTDEQEYYNSKGGLPHIVEGARVTDIDLDKATGSYQQLEAAIPGYLTTMGVDVGSFIHAEICQWQIPGKLGPDINTSATARVIAVRKLRNFEELDQLMRDFQINACVIDMFPERRKAKEFADRFFGFVKLCYYGRGVQTKGITVKSEDDDFVVDHQITVDRTSWIDLSIGRFMNHRIMIPSNIGVEYREHIKNIVRVYSKDQDGNPVGKYENTGPDHFAHARTYAEIALPLAAAITTNSDVKEFL